MLGVGARRAEEGAAAITAEGDEVEIAASIKALRTVAHERVWDNTKSKTAPLKGTRMRHPRLHLLPTKGSARMIYSMGVPEKAKQCLRHPPVAHRYLLSQVNCESNWPVSAYVLAAFKAKS